MGLKDYVPYLYAIMTLAIQKTCLNKITNMPPRNYNPEDGQRKKSISREEAMAELLQVVTTFATSLIYTLQVHFCNLGPILLLLQRCRFTDDRTF